MKWKTEHRIPELQDNNKLSNKFWKEKTAEQIFKEIAAEFFQTSLNDGKS